MPIPVSTRCPECNVKLKLTFAVVLLLAWIGLFSNGVYSSEPNQPACDDQHEIAVASYDPAIESGNNTKLVRREQQESAMQEFNHCWQTDIDIQNQTAQSALKKLADEMGFKLQTRRIPKSLINKKVTLKLQQKSRLEAVEGICQQIGVYPVYDQKSNFFGLGGSAVDEIIRFEKGPRPSSVAFAGPFLVVVSGVKENVPHATGQATLQIVASNLPASVLSRLRENLGGLTRIGAVEGSNGKSVLDNQLGNSQYWPQNGSNIYIRYVSIPLKNLLREVTSIETISGHLKFDIPTEIKTLKFDELKQGAIKKDGKLTVTITRLQLQDDFSSVSVEVAGGLPGLEYKNTRLELFDAEGKPLESFGSGGFASGGKVSLFNGQFQGMPASATVNVISQLADMDYGFELNEIPLKESMQMPVKIEPAQFSGHKEPVALEFVKIISNESFRKVQFKLVNHADKSVDRIDMTLNFLDDGGKKLKEFPSGYQEATIFNQDGTTSREPAVAKKGTKQIEVQAFFMPDNTKTVEAELKSIRFVDAEVWKAK